MESETVETQSEESTESFEQEQSLDFDQDKMLLDDLGIDPSKYGIELGGKEIESEPDQGEESAPQETSILESVNALELIHNDAPLKIESVDQLKSLIQQGFDYTAKTQNLSTERKTWEAERSQAETELNSAIEQFNTLQTQLDTQLKEMQQWQFTFERLKNEAPDVFAEVQSAFENTARQYSNPILDQQLKAMNQRLAEAEKQFKERENKAIVDEFEREKGLMSSTEQSLGALGIKLDWGKIKDEWKNTGLPLKKVVGALYFDDIAKAQASKSKVAATQAKVSVKPVGTGKAARPGKVERQVKNTGDYLSMAYELYNNMR